jgi:hypothetical protein
MRNGEVLYRRPHTRLVGSCLPLQETERIISEKTKFGYYEWIINMMKALKYLYIFLWLFVIPAIIGGGVGEILLRMYHNFSEHLLAGVAVCLFSGAVVTWIPMAFVIQGADFGEKKEFLAITLLLWIAGCVAPMLFGFRHLTLTVTILLMFSAIFTKTKVLSALSEISRKLQNYREKENS